TAFSSFFTRLRDHRHLLSFPTRRSSDLLDPDQLLLEWCNAAVGEDSSPCLKEFYDLWNIFWTKDVVNSSWWKLEGTAYLQFNNRSEEHTSELQSRENLVCRLLLEKKKKE